MIGYAHIQLWTKLKAAIRIIEIEEKERNKGFGKQFLTWIEIWLKWQGYLSVHTKSSSDMIHFYEQMGYMNMPFNDPDEYKINRKNIPIGKILQTQQSN